MRKLLSYIVLFLVVSTTCLAENKPNLRIVSRDQDGHGMLCQLQRKRILFLAGTPEQMGKAHGRLLKTHITPMVDRICLVAGAYAVTKDDWFFSRMEEVFKRTEPHTPKRFLTEIDAMSKAAGITTNQGRYVNFFPEMFHCTGVAVRGDATKDGKVIHARVLDYMADIGLQQHACLMVFMPEEHHAWVSLSFAGFAGTVTAMNEKGLAMGEIGGAGEGNWDGMPMNFLMRQIMEKAANVKEAVEILKTTSRTCEYYYVLSDKDKNMVGVYATPDKLELMEPGQQHKLLPHVPKDCVFISGRSRANALAKRLNANYGKIDVKTMIQMIKRPVAMSSNLHSAVFTPETQDMWFADAKKNSPACDSPYTHINLQQLLAFYRENTTKPEAQTDKQ